MKFDPKTNPLLALTLASGDARITREEVIDYLLEQGIPHHLAYRIAGLLHVVIRVGDATIRIGRVILHQMLEFLRKNPGMAIGAALGAVFGMLSFSVPLIGSFIGPLLTAIGAFIGAAIGHATDRDQLKNSFPFVVVDAAAEFFSWLVETVKAITAEFRVTAAQFA